MSSDVEPGVIAVGLGKIVESEIRVAPGAIEVSVA
jgi:hypothetical protein